ncbi:MAG: ABC transporter ATP-binding protein [Firmicutes bacterium]|nr:ABC transporter ATP-binding protein [Bacillota bacterium]
MGEAVVITRDLQKDFGSVKALRGLDLEVRRGEIWGLIGPDGAGKTTALRLLAGLFPPTRGEALVLGARLTPLGAAALERARHRIGYMPQGQCCYGDLTVSENLHFFGRIYGVGSPARKERIDFLLEFTGLAPFARRPADHLSGGMRQKLGLACSILPEPELLLLDEPTTGVDPAARQDFWDLLRALRQEREPAVLIATPYMDEAARCDQIVLLHEGRVLAVGPPASLAGLLEGKILEVKVAQGAQIYRAREVLASLPGVKDANLFGDHLHLTVEQIQEEEVQAALAGAGLPDAEVRQVPPSCEDIFLSLLARRGNMVERGDGSDGPG